MALTRAEMDRKIDEHFGFEAQDNVDGVLATLAPDAEHDIVGWPTGPTHGPRRRPAVLRGAVRRPLRRQGRVPPAASTATTSWSTSRCGAARRRAGRSASRAGAGRSSSACCTSSSSPPTATMKRENVWIDLAAILQQLPQD